MFRIESYITPIILSHIDKYVKDFRPKDAQVSSIRLAFEIDVCLLDLIRKIYYCCCQVSLWGGEVAFQNLDLRLDVLEEELQLPFSFVSGHIHELTLLVPWTKIASEPIQITINTIGGFCSLSNICYVFSLFNLLFVCSSKMLEIIICLQRF